MRARQVVNWLNLTTLFGLLVAKLGGAAISRGRGGLILAEGYRLGFPVAEAFTVGNVVAFRATLAELSARLPNVLRHEAKHATQYAFLGLAFFPVYALLMAWSWLRTGDRAARHPLERLAGFADGGYREDVS
ncbi:MAG: hypothetical protein LBQ92_05630 [Propionibacteriaceae bacterium]|jgi:hypothetical protein|nr:hypothetical protein [Propionibacteriaceae bacterium]